MVGFKHSGIWASGLKGFSVEDVFFDRLISNSKFMDFFFQTSSRDPDGYDAMLPFSDLIEYSDSKMSNF